MAFIRARAELHAALEQAERCVRVTGGALLAGDAERLRLATQDLHDSAHALALALRGLGGATEPLDGVRERLGQVARDIAQQRAALLRRAALVDRSLQSLLPQARPSGTYVDALERYAPTGVRAAVFRTC